MSTRRGPKPRELLGKTFGYLSVLGRTEDKDPRGVVWLVRCRCGTEFKKVSTELGRKSKTPHSPPQSCGCYLRNNRSSRYKGVGDLSHSKWRLVINSAKRKGFEFQITIQEAWALFERQGRKCALSGVPIVLSPKSMAAGASTASLDRIDSSKGYVPGNIQWVHVRLNYLKLNWPQEEFIEWCCKIADHQRGIAVGAEFGKPPPGKPKHVY